MNIRHFIVEVSDLFSIPLYKHYLVMISFATVGLVNVSDALNIAVISFGYTQVDGSWALCYFYIWGFIGASLYDKYFHHLKQEQRFLMIYTYCG